MSEKFSTFVKVAQVSPLGIVLGWSVICKEKGADYYDLHGHHVPEQSMLEATTDFMKSARRATDMHGNDQGTIVFAFPLTTEIAKSLEITTERTGMLVGMAPNKELLAKFVSGEYTGFSIGGEHIELENAP